MSPLFRVGRRRFLRQAAIAAPVFSLGLAPHARAATFPDHVITFLIPDSGGGSFGSYVREFAELLPQVMHPSVNVGPQPMPGAGGSAAVFNLLHDAPDGYTIGIVNVPGIFSQQYSRKKIHLDLDALTWVANIGRDAYGLAVSAKSDIHSIAELRQLGTKRPVKFASTGFGSTDYFATRVFCSALDVNFRQILGYTGSAPTMVAVARGDVDAVVHSLESLKDMERAGLLRIIFEFQDRSSMPGVEDATSVNQPDLGKIYQWRPIAAPPHVPADIVGILSDAFMKASALPAARSWAEHSKAALYPLDHAATLRMVREQEALVTKWKRVLL